MVYLNSAINPILYNLMSSKFRTGFIICSENRRRLYFKRSRNGTFSTTATSYRSSTLRNSTNDSYRVYYRQRNNSIVIKTDSQTNCNVTGSPSVINKDDFNDIDEISEINDYDRKNKNHCTKSIYDNYPTISSDVPSRCYSVTEEVIHLHEKFVRELNKNDEESFV